MRLTAHEPIALEPIGGYGRQAGDRTLAGRKVAVAQQLSRSGYWRRLLAAAVGNVGNTSGRQVMSGRDSGDRSIYYPLLFPVALTTHKKEQDKQREKGTR